MSAESEQVAEILASIGGKDAASIGGSDRLAEIGLDSLDKVLLAVCIENELGRALSDSALANIHTVADLHHHLQREGGPQ